MEFRLPGGCRAPRQEDISRNDCTGGVWAEGKDAGRGGRYSSSNNSSI